MDSTKIRLAGPFAFEEARRDIDQSLGPHSLRGLTRRHHQFQVETVFRGEVADLFSVADVLAKNAPGLTDEVEVNQGVAKFVALGWLKERPGAEGVGVLFEILYWSGPAASRGAWPGHRSAGPWPVRCGPR